MFSDGKPPVCPELASRAAPAPLAAGASRQSAPGRRRRLVAPGTPSSVAALLENDYRTTGNTGNSKLRFLAERSQYEGSKNGCGNCANSALVPRGGRSGRTTPDPTSDVAGGTGGKGGNLRPFSGTPDSPAISDVSAHPSAAGWRSTGRRKLAETGGNPLQNRRRPTRSEHPHCRVGHVLAPLLQEVAALGDFHRPRAAADLGGQRAPHPAAPPPEPLCRKPYS